ncbi:uncharacterized protein PSFLO_07409 [Pseudozyma flocculosa]|uniref:Peptidase S54 rhomboid domain-containing protein n=1 Tax=Pseudozyma flocculosa TaxID=84751 RepID=A0A5C3FCP5_9BASI|nr:uncharacterized protein PSFLO_07409 [Pseudozyma flocculosa]
MLRCAFAGRPLLAPPSALPPAVAAPSIRTFLLSSPAPAALTCRTRSPPPPSPPSPALPAPPPPFRGLASIHRPSLQTRPSPLAALASRSLHTSSLLSRIFRRRNPFYPRPAPARPTTDDATAAASSRHLDPTSPGSRQLDQLLQKQAAEQLKHEDQYWSRQNIEPPHILATILYVLLFGAGTFSVFAILSIRQTADIAKEARDTQGPLSSWKSFVTSATSAGRNLFGGGGGGTRVQEQEAWGRGIDENTLNVVRKHHVAERLGHTLEWITGWCDQLGLPAGVKEVVGRSFVMVSEAYLDLPPAKEVLVPIIAFNTLVFGLWLLAPVRSRLEGFMLRHFTHRPSSELDFTMLTSTFSHRGGLHFLFNNVALWSFGGSAIIYASHVNAGCAILPEASATPHFLAFFATAGVFAAAASHIAAGVRFRHVAALRGLDVARATVGRQSSLGASGAVYAVVVASALAFPDARISLIFLPMFTLPIGTGVQCMVALDLLGALRGWAVFDHIAHLGGALFGYLYFYYGPPMWEFFKWWCHDYALYSCPLPRKEWRI